MPTLETLIRRIGNSETVKNFRHRYRTDEDYRDAVQETSVVIGAIVLSVGAIGALLYFSSKLDGEELDAVDSAASDGFTIAFGPVGSLIIEPDELEHMAATKETQYFDTDQGMFLMRHFAEANEYV